MTLKITDNQYGRLSYRQLGFLSTVLFESAANRVPRQSTELSQ